MSTPPKRLAAEELKKLQAIFDTDIGKVYNEALNKNKPTRILSFMTSDSMSTYRNAQCSFLDEMRKKVQNTNPKLFPPQQALAYLAALNNVKMLLEAEKNGAIEVISPGTTKKNSPVDMKQIIENEIAKTLAILKMDNTKETYDIAKGTFEGAFGIEYRQPKCPPDTDGSVLFKPYRNHVPESLYLFQDFYKKAEENFIQNLPKPEPKSDERPHGAGPIG